MQRSPPLSREAILQALQARGGNITRATKTEKIFQLSFILHLCLQSPQEGWLEMMKADLWIRRGLASGRGEGRDLLG